MKRYLLTALICLMAAALCLAALAEENAAVWEFENGTIKGYSGPGGDLVIPDQIDGQPVTVIGINFLSFHDDITSVTFPDSVVTISGNAFSSCKAVKWMHLPENLVFMDSCFQSMGGLEEIVIPATVRYMSMYTLMYADSMKSVTFLGECPVMEDVLTSLPEDAVIYVPDDQLEAYTALLMPMNYERGFNIQPSGQNAIPYERQFDRAEFDFDAETGTIVKYKGHRMVVDVPETIDGVTVKAIGKEAFQFNFEIRLISLPDSIEEIGEGAFQHTQMLDFNFPASLRVIGARAFYGYGLLGKALPAGVEEIGEGAFFYGDDRGTIVIPEGVKRIEKETFAKNVHTAELYLPASLEYIGSDAFINDEIIYIHFAGHSVPEMDELAFSGRYLDRVKEIILPWNTTNAEMEAYETALAVYGFENAGIRREEHDGLAYVEVETEGTWRLDTVKMGGESRDASAFSLEMTLTLEEDGTLVCVRNGVKTLGAWKETDPSVVILLDGDELNFVQENGTLVLDFSGNGMVFVKEAETVIPEPLPTVIPTVTPTVAPTATPTAAPTATPTAAPTATPTAAPTAPPTVVPTATPTAVPTAAPTAEPAPALALDCLEKKYICTGANAGGYKLEAASLGGEYSILFHADGTADFVMVGVPVNGLSWTLDGDVLVLDYFGTLMRFVPVDGGFETDFMGAMVLTFEYLN